MVGMGELQKGRGSTKCWGMEVGMRGRACVKESKLRKEVVRRKAGMLF